MASIIYDVRYFVMGLLAEITFIILIIINIITLAKLVSRYKTYSGWKLPIHAISMNLILSVFALLFNYTGFIRAFGPSYAYLSPRAFRDAMLGLYLMSFLCCLLYVLTCWFRLAVSRTMSFDSKSLQKYHTIVMIVVLVWSAIWGALWGAVKGIWTTVAPICIAVIPAIFAVGFIILFRRIRRLVNKLEHAPSEARDRIQSKLTVLAGFFIGSMFLVLAYPLILFFIIVYCSISSLYIISSIYVPNL
eukprot:TRINITY_DN10347_c0_g1_i1.p1 TRINITY_DN10347_c0_g1~~TRINITY_DN10347_c0_g1_i1.p1  ORF type:complete len:247 (-),score=26.79 TRINITY_DN10347_c0_g1_i1:350-1090(-)